MLANLCRALLSQTILLRNRIIGQALYIFLLKVASMVCQHKSSRIVSSYWSDKRNARLISRQCVKCKANLYFHEVSRPEYEAFLRFRALVRLYPQDYFDEPIDREDAHKMLDAADSVPLYDFYNN